MQYLLKISIEKTRVWRLISVDGEADLAHIAALIALAFDYGKGQCSFKKGGIVYPAGVGGTPDDLAQMHAFDTLNLNEQDEIEFTTSVHKSLVHNVLIMKKTPHLDCLMPSCLVGAGLLPDEDDLSVDKINAYYDSDEASSLDLRVVTTRLRAYGSLRSSNDDALSKLGAIPFGGNSDLKLK